MPCTSEQGSSKGWLLLRRAAGQQVKGWGLR